jgi:plasmid stabilization system protein ParE
MAHGLAPQAERDLDDIWLYIAKESGSVEIAERLIDKITHRFLDVTRFPYIGRPRDEDLRPGYSLAVDDYIIVYCMENQDALIRE